MPTIYVSNSNANGYAVGNDSNTYTQMQSQSTPALTVNGAIAKAVAGDTIVINDGTYNETALINVNTANLTIQPQNDYQAILHSPDTTRTFYQNGGGTGLTIGTVVIDAQNASSDCIQQANAGVTSLTIDGTHMINFQTNGIYSVGVKSLTMQGNWLIQSSSNAIANGIYLTPIAAGTISITGGQMSLQSAQSTLYGMYIVPTVSGINLVINGTSISYASSASAAKMYGIYSNGCATYDISNCPINETSLPSSSGSLDGIWIQNSQFSTTKCWVYNNTLNGANTNPSTNASGHKICIGDDSDTQPTYHNTINGVWVYGNTTNNANHQILLGWITKGKVTGNQCTNGVIGVIGKQTTNCLFTGNVLVGISTGGSLRAKYGSGDVYANNTVIMNSESMNGGVGSAIEATNGTASSVIFRNNNIYMLSGISAICVNVQDTSTPTFDHNNYFAVSGFYSNGFVWQGTDYKTMSSWQTAHETTATNVDPKMLNVVNGDYRTDPTGPMYHAGAYVSPDAVDYRGRPFNVKPTIGAYEHTSRDPALTRTVASARAS